MRWWIKLLAVAVGLGASPRALLAEPVVYDIVIYGGTPAAVTAAVQAKRMGKSVIIVCPERHLGGMSSGGLGFTDTGNKAAIGGLAREFYHRVWKHYQREDAWVWQKREEYGNKGQGTPAIDGAQRTMWIFEPHVAESVFEDLIREYEIPVHRDQWLDRSGGVTKEGARILSLKTLSGRVYCGKMFIDAGYEGDLMACAGVDFHVGREAADTYGENWNGVQVGVLHHAHFFNKPVDPFLVPGDPSSGLLPRISADPPGVKGAADKRIQAYCYRMCLTQATENRIPFPKPDGYDSKQYELLLRVLDSGWRELFNKYDPIPNRKTDTNNHGPFSTDNIGYNYDYPEASYEKRQEILQEHQRYQKGLMYFMANDPRVPEDVRSAVSSWGLAKDEFQDNGGWPHQIYVREARRLVGEYVMTEQDCLDLRETPRSVGLGSYTMDSHNVQRYLTPDGTVQNEGDIGVGVPGPYEVSYGSLVPRKNQVENLLVPVCVSSSHIAYGSIRMEPVFMILGQSAATAACQSIDANQAVQDLPYETLRAKLVEDGQVLDYANPKSVRLGTLPGTVVDDSQAKLTGSWSPSSAIGPFHGRGYLHDGDKSKGELAARFEATLEKGRYVVRVIFTPSSNRATNVPVAVHHRGEVSRITLNQREPAAPGEVGKSIGAFECEGPTAVVISNNDTNGHVVIDAVQFVPAEPGGP